MYRAYVAMLAACDPSKLASYVIQAFSSTIDFFSRWPLPTFRDILCMKSSVHRPPSCLMEMSTSVPPMLSLMISTSASIRTIDLIFSQCWFYCKSSDSSHSSNTFSLIISSSCLILHQRQKYRIDLHSELDYSWHGGKVF